jgi:integrase
MRQQNGSIILRSGRWYVTYWERRSVDGAIERKRVTHPLGPKTTRGKYPPADIVAEKDRFMSTLNASPLRPEFIVTVADFVDSVYMPWVKAQKRPATHNGYDKIWRTHLKAHFAGKLLRDYKPHDATVFLTGLADKGMGVNAVNHVRALMSGIFRHAAALGYVTANPIHLAKVLVAPVAPKETPHYTLMEMASALAALQAEPQARLAMALAFIGLRPSEIRGLRWEDVNLNTGELHVCRSAWRDTLSEGGKGKNSVRTVTLGSTIVGILSDYLKATTSQRGFVLENTMGNPLDIDALGRKVIRPTFAAAGLVWKGYYGGRRGAETEMNRYTNGNSQITSHHFGHTKAVADAHYIKPLPDETKAAAIALDNAIQETIGRLGAAAGNAVN